MNLLKLDKEIDHIVYSQEEFLKLMESKKVKKEDNVFFVECDVMVQKLYKK